MSEYAFPDPDKIYIVSDPLTNRSMRGRFKSSPLDSFSTGECYPSAPLEITWAMGGAEPSDFMWTTFAVPLIIHERILEILRQHNLTGWHTYDVAVYNKAGNPVKDYYGLTVTGRCGPQDYSASPIVLKEYPGGWCPQFLGSYYRRGAWNGEAIFMPGKSHGGASVSEFTRIITEPLAKALRKAKVRNVLVERATETRVDTSTIEILQPAALPVDHWQRIETAYATAGKPMPDHVREQEAAMKAKLEALKNGAS